MTNGTFHCPVCGSDFEREVLYGDYNVTCPNGHLLPYISPVDNDDRSHCTCPICSAVFDVDLIPDGPDVAYDFEPGLMEFDRGIYFINRWM